MTCGWGVGAKGAEVWVRGSEAGCWGQGGQVRVELGSQEAASKGVWS